MSMNELRTAAPWLSAKEEGAWRALRRAMVAIQSGTAADLIPTGLSEPDYEVLSTLSELLDRQSTLHAQAEKMGWSRSRLSKHASRMEARGLLVRRPDPADGRGCLLAVTGAGIDALRAATPVHLASVRSRVLDRLSGRDLADLRRIADRLSASDPVPPAALSRAPGTPGSGRHGSGRASGW